MDVSQESDQNHRMRYQCFHPTVKISNASSESAIWRTFLWLAFIDREAIPSGKFSWECWPSIEVSNLLCYLVFTQISSVRLWKLWIHTTRWFLVLLRQFKGKKSQAKLLWQRWETRSEWMILFWIIAEVSIATIQRENNSETEKYYTRSCNGAFSQFHRYNNELLKSVERLCLRCDMPGGMLEEKASSTSNPC